MNKKEIKSYTVEALKQMTDDELDDLMTDVIDARESCSDMSQKGLMLDELYLDIDNERQSRRENDVREMFE